MTVSIYQNDFDANVIDIKTPFYPAWRDFARRIGGRWQWKHKRWEFDVKDEHTVREALRLVFGTDGEEGLASVDVRVALSEPLTSKVYDLGRRLGRPSKSEPGVVRWDTGVDPQDDEGLLLLVHGVPESLARAAVERDPDRYTILEVTRGERRRALRKEIKRLQARIAELQEELT